MPSSDEEEEIYDGEDFHAALLACPAVVGDLVNIPVDLLPSKWVRACEIHPQTVLIGSVLARRAAGGRETVVVRVEGYDRHLLVPGDHESVNQVVRPSDVRTTQALRVTGGDPNVIMAPGNYR